MEYSKDGRWMWTGWRWVPAPREAPRVVMVRKPTNHGVHLLLTVMTLGWWLPIWALVWATEWRQESPKYWHGDLPR